MIIERDAGEIFNQFFGGSNPFFAEANNSKTTVELPKDIPISIQKEAIKSYIYGDVNRSRFFQESAVRFNTFRLQSFGKLDSDLFLSRIYTLANSILFASKQAASSGVRGKNLPFPELHKDELRILKDLLKDKFQIDISPNEINKRIDINFKDDNSFLKPKPTFTETVNIEKTRAAYFTNLLFDEKSADVIFEIQCREIPCHKLFLNQCPHFQALFQGNWKENNSKDPIQFKECKARTFELLLEFLYIGNFKDVTQLTFEDYLDLFVLADFLQYNPLKILCTQYISQNADKSNFLISHFVDLAVIQLQIGDEFLEKFCCWFLDAHPEICDRLNVSMLNLLQLITIYQISKNYKSEKLGKVVLTELKQQLSLDNFIELCQCIKNMKDPNLKSTLVEVLKSNKLVFEQLKEGKKGKYKEQWEAFVDIMTDISL